ncbi:hypothetical protein K470DRAFT_219432 [Piedraia hortae CBS 480.64]|uniref:SUN domain-containing protein n=1 Tax=Piedraia hortae CBS 480.64 TaxID=1314780 RepID=A0A6A7BVP1_9PEZI|nr:hypothetical protein K470DRAFT_219432 [Piedraia hortae CBS 480.64]
MHELITEKLRTAYDDTIGDVHRKLASELRDRDRNSIQLQNKYDELHELNHFSPVLGARIDPRLTSKTLNTRSVFNPLTWANSNDNGPITALQLWQEAGDCWCARPKPNSNIKAQLGVRMGQNINPHDFVVEHLPKYGAADISSAPKDLEFWIKTPSEEHARAVHEIVSFRMTRHKTDLCKTSPPSPDYVCIGTGTYLINGRNWVQRYRSFLQLEDLPMGSSKLVFRVTSTWGSKHTCLYRVRVTGEDVAVGLREGQRRHYYMGKHDR